VRANVRASVSHLKHGSRILERMVLEDGMHVVGAEYNLESGEVEFFQL
jgi:carbonic anhydrase